MISDEFQTELSRKGIMPVSTSQEVQAVFGQGSPFKDKHLEALFHNEFAPITSKALYDAQLVNIYRNYGTEIQMGREDINSAMRLAEEQALKIIEEFNQ